MDIQKIKVFEDVPTKKVKQYDNIDKFIDEFNQIFDHYFNCKQQQLKQSVQTILHQFQTSKPSWNQQSSINTEINNNSNPDNQISKWQMIKQQHQQLIKQTQQIINQKSQSCNIMMGKYVTTIEYVTELEQYKQYISIEDSCCIDEYRFKIQKYHKNKQNYQIGIDFSIYNHGMQSKAMMIKMIDQLNVSYRVGQLSIVVGINNVFDEQIIKLIIKNCQNIYKISIFDQNDQINTIAHNQIKQLVIQRSNLMKFTLFFCNGDLYYSENGLQLMKEYNEIISQKQHLKYLHYYSTKIQNFVDSRNGVKEMIDKVRKI